MTPAAARAVALRLQEFEPEPRGRPFQNRFVRVAPDRGWIVARGAVDLAMLVGAMTMVGAPRAAHLGIALTLLAGAAILAGFWIAGLYETRLRLGIGKELGRTALVTITVSMLVGAIGMGIGSTTAPSNAIGLSLVSSALVGGGRLTLWGVHRAVARHVKPGAATLIIGAGRIGHLIASRLQAHPALGMRPIGFLDKNPLGDETERLVSAPPELPVLGASYDLERMISEHGVEYVILAFSTAPHQVMIDLVRRCWRLNVPVMVVPRFYEVEGSRVRVDHLGGLPLVSLRTSNPSSWQFNIKYALDRAIAGLALLALSPMLAAIAAAVAISMGRPIIFRQQRVGRDGRQFGMLKFRTMRDTPEAVGEADASWAAEALGLHDQSNGHAPVFDHDRRTRVGAVLRRFSLDELPQLVNVLRGEMSLVGPRPERAHYVSRFESALYRYPDRHRVKSGLTGWAQVNGLRGQTSLKDRVEWDNFYIENWSPWLDLKILARTLPAVRNGRGAH